MLGIEDYDTIRTVDNLNPNVREAINFSKKRFGTLDVEKIKRLMRVTIVRELNLIEGRKNACLNRDVSKDGRKTIWIPGRISQNYIPVLRV